MQDSNASDLLARLDALTARVEEQAVEIARLKASPADSRPTEAAVEQSENPEGWSRRDLLLKGAAGLAVAAVGASQADVAHAGTRTTVFTEAGASYGLGVSYPSGDDPAPYIPPVTTTHSLVASTSASSPLPTRSSMVVGTSQASDGLAGLTLSAYGVYGRAVSGNGVRGEIPATSSANAIAMYGLNNSSFAGPGPGAGGFGVYGLSAKGHGLVGATAAAGGAAVVGATNGVVGAYAAAFYGPVIVGGDFTVVGGAKSAAVPHPDGSYRRLYCVESPESWFEDFGQGQVECGRAEIAVDPDFSAVADMDNYHVFVTGYNRDHVLHVTNRTPKGFTVEADTAIAALKGKADSELSGAFSWRIVAKRKDIKGERLAVVTVPTEPTLPEIEIPQPPSRGRQYDK